jgi:hypothetical protein
VRKKNHGVLWRGPRSSTWPATDTVGSRPLATLSDAELLRYGMVLKRNLAVEPGETGEPTETSAAPWKELRREWRRRFPDLPLSATFGDRQEVVAPIGPSQGRRRSNLLTASRSVRV